MTDHELVLKKIARIEACVSDLRKYARVENLATDVRELRFEEHSLQIAIQAALDIASHIVADERLGEPATNRAMFASLVGAGWISSKQGDALSKMAGFRNILVHGYDDVRLEILEDVVRNRLGDLLTFCEAIRARLVE
jgi:uncharacterized protein YutE (UPF0331/DUF86 family)